MNKFEYLICRVRQNLIVGGYKLKETISSKRQDSKRKTKNARVDIEIRSGLTFIPSPQTE